MPEPTATGPNGEKIVFRGGRWQPLTAGAPQSAPQQRAPINTGTDPRIDIARSAEGRAQLKFRQDQDDRQRDLTKEKELQSQADATARGKLLRFIGRASQVALDADDNDGFFETGTSGAFARNIPLVRNAAKDLAEDTKTLRANLAFDALQAMRDASKTGGALGQVSEIELQLLESAVANVNPENQTHENFLKNLEFVRQAYLDKLNLVDPDFARRLGYDPQKAEDAWVDIIDKHGRQFGVNSVGQLRGGAAKQKGKRSNPDDDALIRKYLD